MKKNEPVLVSVTYKVGRNYFTGTVHEKKTGSKEAIDEPTVLGLEDNSCGPDCKCVNGFKWRYITWGGLNKWVETNEPC